MRLNLAVFVVHIVVFIVIIIIIIVVVVVIIIVAGPRNMYQYRPGGAQGPPQIPVNL